MRGDFPLSNLNLNKGDFGDDAGMNFENRDYCFVGKLFKKKKLINEIFFVKVWLMVLVEIDH